MVVGVQRGVYESQERRWGVHLVCRPQFCVGNCVEGLVALESPVIGGVEYVGERYAVLRHAANVHDGVWSLGEQTPCSIQVCKVCQRCRVWAKKGLGGCWCG